MQSDEKPKQLSGGSSKFRSRLVLHEIIFFVCLTVVVGLSAYGIVAALNGHIDVIGATFVNTGIPFGFFLNLSVQPITLLMAASLGLAYSGLELAKPTFYRLNKTHLSFLKLIAFIVIVFAGYEIMYNFAIWTAQIFTSSLLGYLNPDIIVSAFPNPKTPWNLVFATELFTTAFAVSFYCFYFVRQIEKSMVISR
jgi:hypothetical protein